MREPIAADTVALVGVTHDWGARIIVNAGEVTPGKSSLEDVLQIAAHYHYPRIDLERAARPWCGVTLKNESDDEASWQLVDLEVAERVALPCGRCPL